MRSLLMLIVIIAGSEISYGQTTGANSQTGNRKAQAAKQTTTRQQRGSGQYHGNRDTTPGSPMGTGGAGGDMSGSPAASAIETDDQTSKAEANPDTSSVILDTVAKKQTIRKTKNARHQKRHGQ